MAKQTVSLRLDEELTARIDAKADNRTAWIEGAITTMLGFDQPPTPVRMHPRFWQSLDQTAERMGLTRQQAIERFLRERIEREFVFERQKQAFHH